FEECEFCFVRLLRQELRFVARELGHFRHIRFRVLLDDKLDFCSKEIVTAGVIGMGMGVDDRRDGLRGNCFSFVENGLTVPWSLCVGEDDTGFRHKCRSVSSTKHGSGIMYRLSFTFWISSPGAA